MSSRKQMPDGQYAKYTAADRTHCPYCDSINVYSDGPYWPRTPTELMSPNICGACGRTWSEYYTLQRVMIDE